MNTEHSTLRDGKFLSFSLGNEEYAVEILKVQEIIGLMAITPVPGMPDSVLGVINLRGRVIPVVDLRRKFALEAVEHTDLTCIIVMQVGGLLVGALVDEVNEVADLDAADLQETPEMGDGPMSDVLLGVGKLENRVLILLDIDRVLGHEDIAAALADAKNANDLEVS